MTTIPAREGAVGVEMADLRKSYGPTHALADFSLSIEAGEMVVLLGPSGCGKTTALRALAGLEAVDSGSIRVGGAEVTELPAQKRGLAMVFQSYSLFPHLSSMENVAFGLRIRRVPEGRALARAKECLDLVGLADQADKLPHEMSGGQAQRVALARALAVEPRVLLLDEPLSALDAKVRVQLRDEIRRIQRDVGMTTLFVTHDQEEALAVADRVGVMRAGRIEQIDSPERIYTAPTTPFVARFIGVTNRVRGLSDGRSGRALGQAIPLLPGSARGEVDMLVRPESVLLELAEEAEDARVLSVSFLGALARVTVGLKDGSTLVAQLPPSGAGGLLPGTGVRLRFAQAPVLAESVA